MTNSLITKDTILLDLEADSKKDAVHKICGHLFLLKKTRDPSRLYEDIINRELVVSTFAGSYTAIPHAISEHVEEAVLCFVRLKSDDFTWNGQDENVRFIILLSAPASDDITKLRQRQSAVFSSIAQLISHSETLDLWWKATDRQTILDSLQGAFETNKKTIM